MDNHRRDQKAKAIARTIMLDPLIRTALLEEEHHIYQDPCLPIQLPSPPSQHHSKATYNYNHPTVVLSTPLSDPKENSNTATMSLHSDDDSQDTEPTAVSIAPLQDLGSAEGKQGYQPVYDDDPRSFDLVEANAPQEETYSLEKRTDLLFSKEHLEGIFADARLFLKFTTFLSKHRPNSVPLLIYYLDSLKALKAIAYSNAIVDGLEGTSLADFTSTPPKASHNASLQEKSDRAFAILTQEDLPAYITHVFVEIVSSSVHRKITGTMAPQLLQASEGLAEVFCMSDISKPDNPIVFSSEEFHRTTQYGLSYSIGRNCRFLQGPRTSPFSIQRLRDAVRHGREHQETFLNYRRDGSPFMNLLTMAPLLDNQGHVRYYIGAQVDISGLVKDSVSLEALAKLITEQEADEHEAKSGNRSQVKPSRDKKDEFQSLSEMFNQSELETVRVHGGRMHSEQHDLDDSASIRVSNRPRLLIREPSAEEVSDSGGQGSFTPSYNSPSPTPSGSLIGRLPGVFSHYLIIRPYPSLRITFTSPSLRVPGLLQSPFLSRIGGSPRVREELTLALSEGRNVTAKIRWLKARQDGSIDSNIDDHSPLPQAQAGKPRWIHCTPLLGSTRTIGAWMVIMIDGEDFEAKAAQPERIGVVSPSWGRHSQSNSISTAAKSRIPHGRQNHYDPSQNAAQYEPNEWDLDMDAANASMQQQSNNASNTTSTKQHRLRSQSSALSSNVPAPAPPPKSVPAPPVPGYTLSHNIPGARDPARSNTGRSSSRSMHSPGLPLSSHSTFQYRQTSTNPSMDSTLSGALQAGFSDRIPVAPTSPRTGRSGTITAPPIGTITTSTPIAMPAIPPQPQSPAQVQSQTRITMKPSTETLSKKAGFGHRVFHGFRKGGDKEKEKEKDKQSQRPPSRHTAQQQQIEQMQQMKAQIQAEKAQRLAQQQQQQQQQQPQPLGSHATGGNTVGRASGGSGYTMS